MYLKDGFGCPDSTPYVVAPQLTISAIAAADVTCTPNTTINLTASGGTGAYTYQVSNGGAYSASTNPYVTATAGTYTFKVIDAATPACSAFSAPVIVNTKATVLTLNAPKTDVKCKGDASGTINITPTSGVAPYTYSVTRTLPTALPAVVQLSNGVFTGLTAGTYNVVITDGLGCSSASTPVVINEPTAVLSATATAPPTTTCSTSTTVTVTGAGGTGTYTYSFKGGAFTPTNTYVVNDNGVSDQIIAYQVRDANNCTTVSQNITVKKLNPPIIGIITGTAITCNAGQSTSDVTIPTTNGLAPLAFVIVSGTTINTTGATNGKFTGLASGTYLFKVTDANGCSDTESFTVDPVTPIAIIGQNISNVLCNADNTGIAKYTVSGFSSTGNYTVTITTVPAALSFTQSQIGDVITLSDLVVGSYTVTVKDKTTGCSKSDVVTITQPPVLTLVLTSNVNANCSVTTSAVTVTAGGGTPGYTYAFMQNNVAPLAANYGPSSTANLNPTTNTLWDVWVKDAKGCETKLDVTILKDGIPTVTATVQNQCTGTGSSFVIKAVGAGGVGTYTYTINTGVAPTGALLDTFTVAPGTYTITVKDANSCPNTTTVTVNAALDADAVLTKDLTCSIPTAATIKINATGGKSGYSYKVSFNGGAFTAPIAPATIVGNVFTTNVAGTYKFEVTDSNLPTACTVVTNNVTVTATVPVTASYTKVNPTCNGFTDGSIKITALTGESPFTYSITGAAGTFVSSNVFGGLAAGNYDFAVKDSKGCIFNVPASPIVLVNPAPIVANIAITDIVCNANTPGSLLASITSGGVGPFKYTLYSNTFTQLAASGVTAATSYNFTGLTFGDYYITIVDANGCEFKSLKQRIETPPFLTLASPVITGATCVTGATVQLEVISGGVAPYKFSILGQPSTVSPAISVAPYQYMFSNLLQGTTYYFQVEDANLCTSVLEVVIPSISSISVNIDSKTNVTCTGANNGILKFTASTFDATVTTLNYEVLNALTNAPLASPISGSITGTAGGPISGTINSLPPGDYLLKVKESTGTLCSAIIPFQIIQPAQPLLSAIASVVNANCNSGAQVTLTTTGGTGPYTYAVAVAPAVPSTFTSGNVLNLDYALGSNWNIIAKDFNGCTVPLNTTIFKDPSPVIALSVVNKCVAEGAFGINVTITPGKSPYSISVDGSTFASIGAVLSYTVTGLNSGFHTIKVKDANGCIDTKSTTIDKPLNLSPAITALPTCADNDGKITLTGTGGTSSYTYSILPMPAGVTVAGNVISGLPAGTYTVTMRDVTSLCTTTASVTLSKPNKPTFNTAVDKVTCFGSQDGIITVNLTGTNADPVYTYAISPIPLGSVQVGNVFSKLPAGAYTITVTSGRVCSTSVINVTVGTPLALSATAAITDYACNATNIPQPAKVTVNVAAGTGTGPYKYNFDGSTNYYDSNEFYVVDNGSAQTVKFYVKDANGCLFNNQVVVNPYKKITKITFVGSAPTCPIPTSNVKLTVVGGYAITKYEILSPVPFNNGASDTFSGLAPNTTYLFKVTDANGCSFQKAYTTDKLVPIAIVGELVNDISCNVLNGTTNNGKAKYTVTGFSSTGNYAVVTSPVVPAAQITKVGDVITLSGLSAGSYKVTVTDNTTGCSKDATVTITNPVAITFTAIATKVFCSKDVSQITVSGVSGGTGAYTYAVVKAGALAPAAGVYTSSNILTVDTNLTDLSWDVYVKDVNGCVAKKATPVIYNVAPTISLPAQQCFTGANLTVNLSGFTTVYGGVKSYTLDGSALASSTATFTAPGIYKLGIKDDNGCEAFVSYTVQKQLLATATLTKDLYCAAPVNATIKVDIANGVGAYSYQMYLGGAAVGVSTPVVGTSFTVPVATAGNYYFVITDSNSPTCNVTTNTVKVSTPVAPVIASTPITLPILCNGGTATMQVNVDGSIGLAPYTYKVTRTLPTATPTVTQLSNNVFTGLSAGTYSITVTDAKGCVSAITTTVIAEPVVLTATHSYPANTTCSVATVITVVGHDGTPTGFGTGYYYNFNNQGYTTTNTYTVNDNGAIQNISYTVKDANGCTTAPQTVTVNPLSKPTNLTFNASPIYCVAPNLTSTVSVKANKGVGALTFNIIGTNSGTAPALWGPIVTAGFATPASFPGLLPGDYTFQVTDSNGCSYEQLFTVKDVVKIAVTGQLIAGVACKTEANGKVTFTVSGFGAAGFTPTFTGVSGAGVITPIGTDKFELTNLVTGNYRIDVRDNTTGCISNFSVFVPEPAILGVNYVTVKNANCKLGAEIKATAFGGTPGYTYAFVKAGGLKTYASSDTAILDSAFTWEVWSKDAHGCEASMPITIITDPMPAITNVNVVSQCASAAGYRIDVTANGVGPLKYSLDGVQFQDNAFFIVNAPGNYTVSVMDKNQCVTTAATATTILEPLTLRGEVSLLPNCKDADGEITLYAVGGTVTPANNYEYTKDNWASKQSSAVFGGLAPGTYNFKVRDLGTLCEIGVQVIINTPTDVTGITVTSRPVSCNGGSDGTVEVAIAVTNNNPLYTYALSGTDILGNPVSRPAQNSPIFENLRASQLLNDYTVTVTSGRGCVGIARVKVVEPGLIVVNANAINVAQFVCTTETNGANSATIAVNPANLSGGSGNYVVYEFFKTGTALPVQKGVNNVYTEVDFTGGSYTVNVYDDNGCMGTYALPIIIDEYIRLDEINVVKTAITCNNLESITVTALDASGAAIAGTKYDLVDLSGVLTFATNTNGVFTGLAVGDYIITATNPATGCSIQKVHYVNEPNTFLLDAVKTSDVICFGSNEGAVTINLIDKLPNPTNEAGAFSYTVVGPVPSSGNLSNAGPLNLTGLTAGQYTVTATLLSTPYCTVETTFVISQPSAKLKISETHAPITCVTGNNDGSISASAIGGWPGGYEFQLELVSGTVVTPWGSSADFPNLIAGDYIVKVRDAKTCVDQIAVTLVNPTPIVAVLVADKLSLACFGDTNVTLTVQQPVTGGSGFYNYTLEATYPDGTITLNGPKASNVFDNLGVASYRVIVSDTWGCSVVTNTVVISEPTIVTTSLVKASAQTCLSAATLTLSATGGTGPYTYSADPNFTTVLGTFASSVTFAVPFTTVEVNHLYYVKDSNGCVSFSSNAISVTPLEPLDFKYENENPYINCLGDNNGQIIAIAKGGSGNYIYTLFDGSGNVITPAPVQLEPGHFTQLLAGDYLVEVKSGDCTSARKPITITQPETALIYTPVVTDVTCNGNGDGKLELTASGGTGVIKFALSPDLDKFLDSGTFLNLKVGQYEAIIQDERGCNHIYDFEIKEPLPIGAIVDPLSIKQELCYGEKTGEFAITISGGIAPYSTSIDGGTFVPDRVLFAGLTGGKHTVIVKDAHLCEMPFVVLLDPSVLLNPVATVSNECVNDLPANKVTVTIDSSNIPADVKYSLDSTGLEQASNIFTNLTPGDHFIMVHHKNGCIDATETFAIDKIDPLTISIDLGGLNEIVATVTGGSGVYQFTVNGEAIGSNNKYYYFRSGDYTVTVTDSNGCSISATKYFEFIDIKIPPIFTPTGDGTNDNWKPTNTENYPDIKFVVYDRYGRQVGTFGAGQSWDGKYNGTELPMGDYWYVLKLRHSKDDREFIGHFTLYR
ncbi:MAG TPA: T9SS type B sorting domain-containing protein [Flavobacterium sp.]|uniref:T9SS type B sorting domain-containing protein n=1 Tax=Flavobacterium sp. TaxID=239 RepID=UPI002DBF6893|nr:T9SS type B sorting domain-containing protein [Flavobacterium sp.]HEU4790001.1 T9SS type B sorting domain-containing protein [Flavobacterium sp.]